LKTLAANGLTARLGNAGQLRACLCARVAEENKGSDIVVLDMRKLTPMYDYFVITTGTSRRQTHTIADEIEKAMAEQGESKLSIEGYDTGKWIVLDYGDVVVHVFDPQCRDYYELEELWAEAPRLDWRRE
jgi:ribosome-associated protein